MYKYNVQIQKVSGSLNESSMPTKNLVIKSKTEKTDKEVFAEASKYYKEKYGLVIERADVSTRKPYGPPIPEEFKQTCSDLAFSFAHSPENEWKDGIHAILHGFATLEDWAERDFNCHPVYIEEALRTVLRGFSEIDIEKIANAKKIAEQLHKQTLQFIEERKAWDVEEKKRQKANNFPRL
jgi:predicted AAA+ superfamily ATPase